MKVVLSLLAVFFLLSCTQLGNNFTLEYPGDHFSRTLGSVKCDKLDDGIYHYQIGKGLTLYLNTDKPYFIDHRDPQAEKTFLEKLHYNSVIDSSLRYFIREGIKEKELKRLFGKDYEKWGGIASPMLVWSMADGRYIAILPSALEMPPGMNSYNILNKYQKLYKNIRLLELGKELK
jgi:hypothetical protein